MSSPKAYGRYETGETTLDMPHLESIAKVFEMSVIEVLSFDEKMVFNNCTQNHVLGSHNTYNEGNVKEREQLLLRIAELEEDRAFLREQLRAALRGTVPKSRTKPNRKQ